MTALTCITIIRQPVGQFDSGSSLKSNRPKSVQAQIDRPIASA
jgi:hypothetical protein